MNNNTPLTICLIDDDNIYQLITSKIIEMVNPKHKVISFLNGQQAVDFIVDVEQDSSSLPDVIFLDINMPVMNGWEFLDAFSQLRNIDKQIPVYMVSSSVNEEDVVRSKSYKEVKDFIVKPMGKMNIAQILETNFSEVIGLQHTKNAHLTN